MLNNGDFWLSILFHSRVFSAHSQYEFCRLQSIRIIHLYKCVPNKLTLTDACTVDAVVVAAETSFAELQSEVRVTDRLALSGTDVRRQSSQYQIATLHVSSDAVDVVVAAEITVRSSLYAVCNTRRNKSVSVFHKRQTHLCYTNVTAHQNTKHKQASIQGHINYTPITVNQLQSLYINKSQTLDLRNTSAHVNMYSVRITTSTDQDSCQLASRRP